MSAWRWSTCRHVSVGDLLAYHLPTDKSHILPGYIGYMCLCGLMLLWYIPKFVPIIYIYIMYIYIYDHMHIFIYIYIYILSGCPISWSIHVYLYTYNTLVLSFSLLIFNCLLGQLPSSWETLAEGCSHATWKGPVAHHAMYCASQLHVFSKNKTVEEGCLFSKEYCILHRFFQQVMYSLQ